MNSDKSADLVAGPGRLRRFLLLFEFKPHGQRLVCGQVREQQALGAVQAVVGAAVHTAASLGPREERLAAVNAVAIVMVALIVFVGRMVIE